MINKSILFLIAFAAALFTACGDDSNSASNNSEQAGCSVVDNKDGSYTLTCADGSEVSLHNGKNGTDGTDGKNGTNGTDGKDGVNGTDGKDGSNGTDGKDGVNGVDGKDGADGANGANCIAVDTTDEASNHTGYKLMCGKELMGVIWNGVNGKDGVNGDPGEDGAKGNPGENGDPGMDGTNCTVADTTDEVNNRTGYNFTCGGEHKGTIWNGEAGTSCNVEELPNGIGYKILCGGDSVGAMLNANIGMCGIVAYSKTSRICDERDEQIYRVVTIGFQTWMAQNLNYSGIGSCNGSKDDNCAEYGRLYRGDDARTVCPGDWHLPSNEEWEILFDFVGGTSLAGTVLKSTTGWDDKDDGSSGNGIDSFGFGALPAGECGMGGCSSPGRYTTFWTSTAEGDDAGTQSFYRNYNNVSFSNKSVRSYLSVRCVKD